MKLSPETRQRLQAAWQAAWAERRDPQAMEAAGYYLHGITLSEGETIEDAVVSRDGKSILIKSKLAAE
ncbi:hypothetical protein EVC14_062 [Rhizobium phage RHph_I3_18]|nr:hypothetical protein EVC14_062 [Rhizobium phage RHph_I3_18]